MNICGLTDSIATLSAAPDECPHCHASSRVGRGLCLSCLLLVGAEAEDDLTAGEFEAALAALPVADTSWRLGNYEILEEIGRGGMGVIYRARQRHSRRIVALKRVLSYHADSRDTLARFRREAEAAASLDHPNILPIYEVGESEDGVPFFSMKFAPGGSLQEAGPALRGNPREVVRLMAKVTRAVQCAHRQGILHRDLKPGNILLDGRGEPLVSDFGLAKWLDTSSDLTRSLTIFGTPGYIAPEQAQGNPDHVKPAADVYSLGAILFVLLTGRPPFLGEHALAVIRQAENNPAPKLRTLVKGADKDLETICARCLAREATARYSSAGDLAEDLERWLEGRPIIARPVSPPTRVWRWARRNPLLAGTSLICLLLTVVALTWGLQSGRLKNTVMEDEIAAHSIAVLPFLDLDNAVLDLPGVRFIKGLQTEMQQLGPVRIEAISGEMAAQASAGNQRALTGVARAAKARAVLSGTKREIDGHLRASIRLFDSDGNLLWCKIIDYGPDSFPGIPLPHEDAASLYSILDSKNQISRVTASGQSADGSGTAHDLILAGKALLDDRTIANIEHAMGCFQRAIEADPKSALAHALYAGAIATRSHFKPDPALLNKAEISAREAVKLDPNAPDGHRTLSGVLFQKGDFSDSLSEAFSAVESGGPEERVSGEIGETWKLLGRPNKAIPWFEIMSKSEARPANFLFLLADCRADLCEDQSAAAAYERARQLRPDLPEGWLGLCRLRLIQGDFKGARALCSQNSDSYKEFIYSQEIAAQIEFFSRNFPAAAQIYQRLEAADANGGGSFYGAVSYQSALGRLKCVGGDEKSGREALNRCLRREQEALKQSPTHPEILYRLAAISASLGNSDSALQRLRAAADAGWLDYRSLALDPRFDSIRRDTRFSKISEGMATRVASLRRQSQPNTDD